MAQERVSNIQVIANTLKAVLTDACLKLTKVDSLVQIICRQLVLVTRRSLWDTLMQTLLQMAQLHCQDLTTSLLHISIPGDIDVALQLQGNPRTSENCPDKSCYGQGGPADSELWHHTTTEAMWSMLVCEPSILSGILKSLLLIQHTSMSHNIFGTKCSCRLLLTVAIVMRMIFLLPSNQSNVRKLVEELFMAMVLQISFTMKNPQEGCCGSEIWRKEAGDRVVNRRRCMVRTIQAFFRFLGGDSLIEDIKGEGAWDMLMSPCDYPSGIRVLSRVLKCKEWVSCPSVCEEAVGVIQSYEDSCAIIVFIELLDCTRFKADDSPILRVLHVQLHSRSSVLRKVAVTRLAVLSEKPQQLKRSRSRLEDYLYQSLLCLQSPQEPLRKVALRFVGPTGQQLKDECKEKILVINEALQNMESDSSPLVSSLVLEMKQMLYDACEEPPASSLLPALWCCLRRAERSGIPNQLV